MYYQQQVFFCTNRRDDGQACCADHQAGRGCAYLKRRTKELGLAGQGGVRINRCGCLGRCDLGPVVVVYPQGVWYSYVDEADLEEILQKHLIAKTQVKRLQI